MKDQIEQLRLKFLTEIENVQNQSQIEDIRLGYFSRGGAIASLFEKLREVPVEQKPEVGKLLNSFKAELQSLFDIKKSEIELAGSKKRATFDPTLPGRPKPIGTKHPITQSIEEIKAIFARMGFSVALGPEVEDDYHNFTALNFPPEHPSRDMQDTFFISKNVLLRTHTSPVQIRVMSQQKPPVRVIMPGRVYRNEAISSRSHSLFHQIEGLYVDKGVTFSELKGTLVHFVKQFYGSNVKYMFRPTFFPFTEPSADMYITCFICGGKSCRVCKQTGWLEILGSGMVHPNVLRNVGYDSEIFTGYAFGIGIERTVMLRYGIDDIRLFYENDLKFLRQF